jgi:hypothetical protein
LNHKKGLTVIMNLSKNHLPSSQDFTLHNLANMYPCLVNISKNHASFVDGLDQSRHTLYVYPSAPITYCLVDVTWSRLQAFTGVQVRWWRAAPFDSLLGRNAERCQKRSNAYCLALQEHDTKRKTLYARQLCHRPCGKQNPVGRLFVGGEN